MNDADLARRVRELASRVRTLPPQIWTDPERFFEERSELARDMDQLASDLAPGVVVAVRERKPKGGGTRIISTEVQKINGRHVTVQRRRSAFAIVV